MKEYEISWNDEIKAYELKEKGFDDKYTLIRARALFVKGAKSGFAVFLEDMDRTKYMRVGSIREEIEKTFITSASNEKEAKENALEAIMQELRSLIK